MQQTIKRLIGISVLFLICISGSFAQNDEQQAFQTFKKARESFQNNHFESAAKLFLETKELLGSTNVRIQPMLIKSLVEIEDWRQAKQEVKSYLELNPDTELVEFQEIISIQQDINNKISDEEGNFSKAKASKSIDDFQFYLNSFPYGKYRDEVQEMLEVQEDENAWNKAKEATTTPAYYEYLDQYPNGKYKSDAEWTIIVWDDKAFDKAIYDGSQHALQYYLDNYPRGEHQDAIRRALDKKIEIDSYESAKASNNIDNYINYVKRYPSGKFTYEATQIIGNTYYQWGMDAFKNRSYDRAKGYFELFLYGYPIESKRDKAQRKLNLCKKLIKQSSASFFMFTYDSISPFGISAGGLNKRVPGFYFNLKMNATIFKGINALWDIDNQGISSSPWDVQPTGVIKPANASLSMGMTFKILHPLWGYVGASVNYFTQYEEVDEFTSSGELYETVWMRNTDVSSLRFFPEVGVKLKIGNALVLKYGISKQDELLHQFGLGFPL